MRADRGALGHPLEHERDALARVQGELGAHARADLLERDRGRERQREARRREERSAIAELERVLRPAVVEGRLALERACPPSRARTARGGSGDGGARSPGVGSIGMKSCTSPTPSGSRERVIRTFVSGK